MKIKNFPVKTHALALATFSTLFLFSCQKKVESSGVNYEFKTVNRSSTVSRTMGTLNWTGGYAVAKEIKFEAKKEDLKVEYKSKAEQKVDLFSSSALLGMVQLPAGSYKKVELKIELLPGTSDAAFELRGNYDGTPVVFKVNEPFQVKTEKEGIDIATGASYTAATSMNLSMLTQGVSESKFKNAEDTNGQIIISATSNGDIYAVMVENLKNLDDCDFK